MENMFPFELEEAKKKGSIGCYIPLYVDKY